MATNPMILKRDTTCSECKTVIPAGLLFNRTVMIGYGNRYRYIHNTCPFCQLDNHNDHYINDWCQSDWEYSQSMDYFIEMCDANDYEFDEHGDMI